MSTVRMPSAHHVGGGPCSQVPHGQGVGPLTRVTYPPYHTLVLLTPASNPLGDPPVLLVADAKRRKARGDPGPPDRQRRIMQEDNAGKMQDNPWLSRVQHVSSQKIMIFFDHFIRTTLRRD